ncbi:Multidrug resistance protein 1 [Lasiodiplodia hormozganensis]|uniref:Multidrug resistance protein 1 n=1 Tax=Lasiodiplodia hormozganensis TaxID=869390 RepID=A0AA40D3X9_9PEZI|nr:Multidrug resistance protein 1 [Lasiodiplodia hormozganensis]
MEASVVPPEPTALEPVRTRNDADPSAGETRSQHARHSRNVSAGDSQWRRDMDVTSLSTAQPRAWHAEIGGVSKIFFRRIAGLNPFKTSYFSLYRPLKSFQDRCILIAGVILGIAAGVPLPLIGVIFGHIIDAFPPSEHELAVRISQLLGVAVAYFVVTWGWAVCWGIIGERTSRGLREALVERALGMEMAYFDVEAPDMTSILTEKTQTVQLGTSEKVGLFIQSISYFVAAFTVGFILDAQLTGILLVAVIPTMFIIITFGSKTVAKLQKSSADVAENAAAIASSALKAVQVVQAFGIADKLADEYLELLKRSVRIGVRKSIAGAAMLGCVYFTAYSANALAFWYGTKLQEDRGADGGAGTIYAVVFLILDASFVVGQFGPFIQTFAMAAGAGESIFEVLDHADPHIDVYAKDGETPDASDFAGGIRFENVTFVYPARPTARVLNHVNLNFQPGAVNGIVGASGSGKSTVAGLLLRFYDPSSGKVTIGSKDIKQFNVGGLRSRISMVNQEPVLFSGTIFENIKYGLDEDHGLSDEEVLRRCEEAAQEAACDFFDILPDGIHTVIGSSGHTSLSGGQKQRICLARALVGNPSLLILDEYTSAMDATSEALVLKALDRATSVSGRTTIIVAHRLATIKNAAKIMVMEQGNLIEEGTHESLIEMNGTYSRLVEAQKFDKSPLDSKTSSITATPSIAPMTTEMDKDTETPTAGQAQPSQASQPSKPFSIAQVLRRAFLLSKPETLYIMLGLFASMCSGGIIIGEAIIFGSLVSTLNTDFNSPDFDSQVNFFCLMFFILSLIALCAYMTSGSCFGVVSQWLLCRIQDTSLRNILRQDVSWFSKPGRSSHALMSSLSMDAGHISGLSGVIIGTIFSVTTSICGGIILAHVVAWKIAVVLLAAVPIMLVAGFFRLRVLSMAEERHETAYNDAAALASEACAAIRTVSALGRERGVFKQYKQAIQGPYQESLKFTLIGNILLAFSLSITYFVYALAYWWGSRQVREGMYGMRDFFIVLPALLFSAQSAGQMFSLAPEITRAKSAARNVFKLHDEKPSIIVDEPNTTSASSLSDNVAEKAKAGRKGTLELRNVSLAYPSRPDTLALKGISLSIRAGEYVAFVGRSGAGKSSSIALIERFFDPTSGTVFMDGENIKNKPVYSHRARIGLVEQEPNLFPGSIMHNVSLGVRPGVTPTREDVERVCKMCALHEFIMSLPEGYNTEVGANGGRLSGGQRQRLAIARALIRDPEILLLDEATSQLDATSEKEVRRAIAAASSGRTTIMVAHRLASVQKADRIFVFDNGRIVEQGNHDELVAQGGIYSGMVETQQLT